MNHCLFLTSVVSLSTTELFCEIFIQHFVCRWQIHNITCKGTEKNERCSRDLNQACLGKDLYVVTSSYELSFIDLTLENENLGYYILHIIDAHLAALFNMPG